MLYIEVVLLLPAQCAPKDIAPYAVEDGNLAVLIRKRFSKSEIKQLLRLKWYNWPIE
ncbi:LbetaH domain-containing protein [Kriegella aquimaris]|uniref:hypothetical protein n=1 Tax=Kriegella aquimaris TaxID=192904 RepID=UPI0015A2BBA2|nr:hypothetical protein [Kriegella aquimaris]